MPLISVAISVVLGGVVLWFARRRGGPFGAANTVTFVRLILIAPLIALLAEPPSAALAWLAIAIASLVLVLDGVDGWVARRLGAATEFGARFDMETDALLILVSSALCFHYDKAGAWILIAGLMRYAFVGLGRVWPWMSAPLPASRRRQIVCVVQIVTLLVCLAPPVARPWSFAAGGVGLGALGWSFAIDVRWLASRAGPAAVAQASTAMRDWLFLALALFFLNFAVTFHNVWPTPWITMWPEVSIEIAVLLLALALCARLFGKIPSRLSTVLAIVLTLMTIGRYAEVTTPALYGRAVNLYWDAQYLPNVAAMLVEVASPVLLAAIVQGSRRYSCCCAWRSLESWRASSTGRGVARSVDWHSSSLRLSPSVTRACPCGRCNTSRYRSRAHIGSRASSSRLRSRRRTIRSVCRTARRSATIRCRISTAPMSSCISSSPTVQRHSTCPRSPPWWSRAAPSSRRRSRHPGARSCRRS
jgi:phosphatidylglycerophosphate synthase